MLLFNLSSNDLRESNKEMLENSIHYYTAHIKIGQMAIIKNVVNIDNDDQLGQAAVVVTNVIKMT